MTKPLFQSYRPTPSLEGAYARVGRARQHLRNLKRQVTGLSRSTARPSVSVAAGTTGVFWDVTNEIPSVIPILAGETIYNLRAALDYLVYELAFLDSEQMQEKTQFPIEDSPKQWRKHGRRLQGLSNEHTEAVKGLQPFSGCEWTAVLRDISNPDKHRHLVAAYPGARVPVAKEVVHEPALQMLFEDGRPVIETLRGLCERVSEVLDQFIADF